MIRYVLLFIFLFTTTACAQNWIQSAEASFEAIMGTDDGSLFLIRYPCDILRSTDTGETWQVVYRGGHRVWGIGYGVQGIGYRV